MKPSHFCILLLTISTYACKDQHQIIPVIALPDYDKGSSFLNKQNDSAFYYFNKVATNSKDSVKIATAYNMMAVIQSGEGDYYGSQESLLTSLKYLDEQNEEHYYTLASDYNDLAGNSLELKNYEAAIGYCDEAVKFMKDDNSKAITLNIKATVYQKMQQYAQAIGIYQSIINNNKQNKKEYARVLSNLAKTRWLQDSNYQAAPDLLVALKIRKEEHDDWGLNASYAHLADYYSRSRPDSALIYADKMYTVAQQLNSPDDELEALQKLITLSPPKALKQYFIRYQYLSDSVQTVRNAAKNQFALIRYEAEKSKVDNLRLQKDNAEKRVKIIWQRIIIYGTCCILIVVIAWYRKRRQQTELKARNAIRESELKTSQKVHDVVANGLYQIMTKIEHQDVIEKEPLLDEIEILYEQSRDISYEQEKSIPNDFQEVMSELLASFSGPATKVVTAGNDKNIWNNIPNQAKRELEYILQELMINMKKHSAARNVSIRFEREGDHINIHYVDDGVGLPSNFSYGNGLTNTENRIKSIGGRITFDKSAAKGLRIKLYFPIT